MIDPRLVHEGCGGEVGAADIGDTIGICDRCHKRGEIEAVRSPSGDIKTMDGRTAVRLKAEPIQKAA